MRPAWELLQRGECSDDPQIRAAQERLQACSYAMAHPESGTLVPACAQHSVLDPLENLRLQELLPTRGPSAAGAVVGPLADEVAPLGAAQAIVADRAADDLAQAPWTRRP